MSHLFGQLTPWNDARRASRARQRGATAIAMLLTLLFLISMLGMVEVSYLYWTKRDTQKVADLAALAGAQLMSACVSGNTDNTAARGNAVTENGFSGPSWTLQITCGTWDPVANSGITDHFSTTASGSTPNAVKVVAQRPVSALFGLAGQLPNITTEAVATSKQPIAVFSVGSTLATVSNQSTLGGLLTAVGISIPQASLVGYNGLANATVTPAGLLAALGVQVPANITVGGLNTLLASSANAHALIDVLNATVVAAGQQQLLSANTTLVNAISTAVGSPPGMVTLGSNGATPTGLFAQITAPDSAAQSALNAQVNALQLVSTAIGVATGQHAINVPSLAVNVPPNVVTTQAKASVIEPPAIGIGGVGTTAFTSQVRAFIQLGVNSSNAPLVGGLLSTLGTQIYINIPIAIDLVNAKATLTGLCTSKDSSGRDLATIQVNSSVLKTCVGAFNQSAAFSTTGDCSSVPGANTDQTLLKITVGGATVANVTTHFAISALDASGSAPFYVGQQQNVPTNGTPLTIGTTVSNIFTAITTLLLNGVVNTTNSSSNGSIVSNLASDLWSANAASGAGNGSGGSNIGQLTAALNQLDTANNTLGSFLQNLPTQVTSILGSTLTLNVGGLLQGVTGLAGGVLNLVNNVLGQAGCALSTSACIGVIQGAMNGSSNSIPNGMLGLFSLLIQQLQTPLNNLGTGFLTPMLNNTLGIDLGVSTVTLHSLQCHGVQLVY
ncbi:TadG family pilus assembly protein [Dyella japonica]|uniref:TadG family pilus assembly protein n=1 Tax=Dyella japonica TaxID=231455 RepID=UPI00118547D4|nr:TadG family pilus assembly protein [Dyella japonica]